MIDLGLYAPPMDMGRSEGAKMLFQGGRGSHG